MLNVGYLFTPQMKENRRDAILRIVVLTAFYEIIVAIFQPTLADWAPLTKQPYAGTPVNTLEWFLYDLARRGNMFFNLAITITLGALALHVGSKLEKRG